jgi:hypothetical protein
LVPIYSIKYQQTLPKFEYYFETNSLSEIVGGDQTNKTFNFSFIFIENDLMKLLPIPE